MVKNGRLGRVVYFNVKSNKTDPLGGYCVTVYSEGGKSCKRLCEFAAFIIQADMAQESWLHACKLSVHPLANCPVSNYALFTSFKSKNLIDNLYLKLERW